MSRVAGTIGRTLVAVALPDCSPLVLARGDRRHADARAPVQKFLRCPVIGPPCVRVADVGGEELRKRNEARPPAAVTGVGSVDQLIGASSPGIMRFLDREYACARRADRA